MKDIYRNLYIIIYTTLSLVLLISCSEEDSKDILTQEERIWLQQHPKIRIAVGTNFPPFQFTDENHNRKGLSIDFMNLIEEKIGYEFEKVYFDNWQKIMQAGENNEVDIILEIQENQKRRKYFNFTQPFIEIPHAIIMRKSFERDISLEKMQGMRIVVIENYAIHDYLKINYPDLTLIPLPDDSSCLHAVSLNQADAMISSQAQAVYFIQREAISNLHIVGNAKYNNILAFGVRKDWPLLTKIIDKGLARIKHSERHKIFNRWLQLNPISFWKQKKFWIFISFVGGIFIFIISIIAIYNQILKRKVRIRTQQLQLAKERAEESNRLKSSFLANMSHEIRTPLNAIQGFAELLNQNDLEAEKKKKYTQIINSNCKSLIHLINEILDLSIIESKQITILKKEVNLIEVAEKVINSHIVSEKQRSQVVMSLQNDLPSSLTTIYTDPIRLTQILSNLISNSLKFTHSGEIVVGLTSLNREEILIYVKDTGIGIDNDSILFIFDRFTKVEKDNSILYRGFGLGLNISKKLLELMGGKIWVESEPGKGSTFFFTLPTK